jgi:hypothetical protein
VRAARAGRCPARARGFKTATAEELPDAVVVMDSFHVVTRWTAAAAGSNKICTATAGGPRIRSTLLDEPAHRR